MRPLELSRFEKIRQGASAGVLGKRALPIRFSFFDSSANFAHEPRDLPGQLRSNHQRSSRCHRACPETFRRRDCRRGAQRRETAAFLVGRAPRFTTRNRWQDRQRARRRVRRIIS